MNGGPHWWIHAAGGRWHAWPASGGATACGAVTADRLRARPALAIAKEPPADGEWCRICAKRLGIERSTVSAHLAGWVGAITRTLIRKHLRGRVPTAVIHEFAALLAEVGDTTSAEAAQVFAIVWPLFFKKRGAQARAALALCPKDAAVLRHLAASITAWHAQTARAIEFEAFIPERVIGTMLRVKDPAAYVRVACEREKVTFLAAVWHPDRYARLMKQTEIRGALAGSETYWQATADQLHVLTD